jgi:16S rRNA C1402 (ribose-2'-O) methylase RsmI
MAVRVSIVEDDRVTRETLSALVRQEPGLQFVAAYADAPNKPAKTEITRRLSLKNEVLSVLAVIIYLPSE